MKRRLGILFFILGVWLIIAGIACSSKEPDVFHVSLTRNDNEMLSVGQSFVFEEETLTEALEKYKPKLPEPLPNNTQLTFSYAGPFFGLLEKDNDLQNIKLTLDVNMNHDLTDDAAFDLPLCEDWKDGTIVKVARSFDEPEERIEWLPYKIGYSVNKGSDGKVRENIFICSNYRYEGEFRLNNRDYEVKLMDGDLRGRFILEKLVNVYVSLGLKSEKDIPGTAKSQRLFELAQLEDKLFEFKAIAEDGSWIELAESNLPTTAIGKPAPDMEMTDMEGQSFNLSDYRGKVLLLDFWPVWCKPCIAKFPDIKKMIQRFEDKPFAVIGINIDETNRVDQAKKVIAEYELTWRQVVEGKGEFIPSYQVYGRLPERPMSFPIYVVIDELGFTRYATNDFLKIDRFLEAHFSNPEDPQHVLFIPLSQKRTQQTRPVIAVDFKNQKVSSLMETEETTMPADIPAEARIGLLPNGTMLIAYPSPSSDKVHLILDSNRDFDLTNDEGKDIPMLNEPVTDNEQTTKMRLNITYAAGGRGFYTLYFFARPAEETKDDLFPEVLFRGFSQNHEGFFFDGKKEYAIEIQDPTGDFLFTPEDSTDPNILELKIKKKDEWITLHQGIRQIPIGGSFYRLKSISDQGQLVELEKEK